MNIFTDVKYCCILHGRVCVMSTNEMHYDNTPMQYTAICHGCKNGNLQMKKVIFFLFFAHSK